MFIYYIVGLKRRSSSRSVEEQRAGHGRYVLPARGRQCVIHIRDPGDPGRAAAAAATAYLQRPALPDHGPPTRTADMKNNGPNNAINVELNMPEGQAEIVVLEGALSVKYHCANSATSAINEAKVEARYEFEARSKNRTIRSFYQKERHSDVRLRSIADLITVNNSNGVPRLQ